MELLFWTSVAVAVYVYIGYPLLLAAWARVRTRPVRKRTNDSSRPWPGVTIVLAAHNEAGRLHARIRNLLQQDYPGELELILVSDGSSDDTAAVASGWGERVRFIEVARGGKPRALNAGVARASFDILVFADARQRFAPDAVRRLVMCFDDPSVGAVTGELILESGSEDGSGIGQGVGLYWTYEKWMRRLEARVDSTLGATGAIYAMRRALWRPLPAETLLDDVLAPMWTVLAGYRVVFEEQALAFDRPERDTAAESRRKTRTLAGNYQILWLEPRLLVPGLNRVWLQYVSHKVGRLLVPWCLGGALISSIALSGTAWIYTIACILQVGFYGLALIGAWLERQELNGTSRATQQTNGDLTTGSSVHRNAATRQALADRSR
jgi:biofilm PGA synthesis N-glycosyltransferase PgaC